MTQSFGRWFHFDDLVFYTQVQMVQVLLRLMVICSCILFLFLLGVMVEVLCSTGFDIILILVHRSGVQVIIYIAEGRDVILS